MLEQLEQLLRSCCGARRPLLQQSRRSASSSSISGGASAAGTAVAKTAQKGTASTPHVTVAESSTRGKRVVVVGDVHGCSVELGALLAKVGFRRGEDIAVFVGDFVAKGPDSGGVVDAAMELGALGVRGNHDHYVLNCRRERADPAFADSEHARLARSLSARQLDWLEALPLSLHLAEHGVTVVHAGLVPGVPLAQQAEDDLLHIRNVVRDSDGSASGSSNPSQGVPWIDTHSGPHFCVFGHDAKRKLQQSEWAAGLDTGCVYGGQLSAMVFPGRKLVAVDAQQVYQQPAGPPLPATKS